MKLAISYVWHPEYGKAMSFTDALVSRITWGEATNDVYGLQDKVDELTEVLAKLLELLADKRILNPAEVEDLLGCGCEVLPD